MHVLTASKRSMNTEALKVDWHLGKKSSFFKNTDKNASASILMHK